MYLISAYFDDKSSMQLQKLINVVAAKTENDFMVKNNVPPHMTVASFEARDVEIAKAVFDRVKNQLSDNPYQNQVLIPSVGMLLPYVVHASVVKSDYLEWLNKSIDVELNSHKDVVKSKYYIPDMWMPHITIGKTLNREQLELAIKLMINHFQLIHAQIVKIGLAKTNPHEDLDIIGITSAK